MVISSFKTYSLPVCKEFIILSNTSNLSEENLSSIYSKLFKTSHIFKALSSIKKRFISETSKTLDKLILIISTSASISLLSAICSIRLYNNEVLLKSVTINLIPKICISGTLTHTLFHQSINIRIWSNFPIFIYINVRNFLILF